MNPAFPWQYCIDQLAAKPGGEIVRIVARNHGHGARCNRRKPLRRRQPHQHLRFIDRGGAFDTEAITIEQQRQIAETHSIDKIPHALAVFGEIRWVAAKDDVALAEAQMSEQTFDIFDTLQHAEHHDHIGSRRGFGREFVGIQIDDARSAFLAGLAGGCVVAAIRQQGRNAGLAPRSRTRAPAGMNCAASSAHGSGFARDTVDWPSTSAGSSSARLLLTKRAICSVPRSRCRTQHMPANQFRLPNHRCDSRSTALIEKSQFQKPGRASCRIPPRRTAPTGARARSHRRFRRRGRTRSPGRSTPRTSRQAICARSD